MRACVHAWSHTFVHRVLGSLSLSLSLSHPVNVNLAIDFMMETRSFHRPPRYSSSFAIYVGNYLPVQPSQLSPITEWLVIWSVNNTLKNLRGHSRANCPSRVLFNLDAPFAALQSGWERIFTQVAKPSVNDPSDKSGRRVAT